MSATEWIRHEIREVGPATIERYGEAGGVGGALRQVFETRDIQHVLAVALMASAMFLFYNAFGELGSRLGEDNVRAAFFGKAK